jgi:hypothetical protein
VLLEQSRSARRYEGVKVGVRSWRSKWRGSDMGRKRVACLTNDFTDLSDMKRLLDLSAVTALYSSGFNLRIKVSCLFRVASEMSRGKLLVDYLGDRSAI